MIVKVIVPNAQLFAPERAMKSVTIYKDLPDVRVLPVHPVQLDLRVTEG